MRCVSRRAVSTPPPLPTQKSSVHPPPSPPSWPTRIVAFQRPYKSNGVAYHTISYRIILYVPGINYRQHGPRSNTGFLASGLSVSLSLPLLPSLPCVRNCVCMRKSVLYLLWVMRSRGNELTTSTRIASTAAAAAAKLRTSFQGPAIPTPQPCRATRTRVHGPGPRRCKVLPRRRRTRPPKVRSSQAPDKKDQNQHGTRALPPACAA